MLRRYSRFFVMQWAAISDEGTGSHSVAARPSLRLSCARLHAPAGFQCCEAAAVFRNLVVRYRRNSKGLRVPRERIHRIEFVERARGLVAESPAQPRLNQP